MGLLQNGRQEGVIPGRGGEGKVLSGYTAQGLCSSQRAGDNGFWAGLWATQ
jgi:hypothetical protein